MPIYGRKMYGQLKRPPMEEWSKQRHVDHVALIYFQKMLQVLTSHTSKLPKKVLKNTKNMTPKWGSVRSADFLPYEVVACFLTHLSVTGMITTIIIPLFAIINLIIIIAIINIINIIIICGRRLFVSRPSDFLSAALAQASPLTFCLTFFRSNYRQIMTKMLLLGIYVMFMKWTKLLWTSLAKFFFAKLRNCFAQTLTCFPNILEVRPAKYKRNKPIQDGMNEWIKAVSESFESQLRGLHWPIGWNAGRFTLSLGTKMGFLI